MSKGGVALIRVATLAAKRYLSAAAGFLVVI
jgi:hypothetical protein